MYCKYTALFNYYSICVFMHFKQNVTLSQGVCVCAIEVPNLFKNENI